ncbi:DNA translocase FtsK [Candidatus Gracilibacteria bacterium 28_42_T64]|nr:DNA translocase FtsK [Candidatus Gracilibacteria bacterium 28_42_T64]
MPPRKKTVPKLNPDIKKYIFATIFLFLSILVLLADTKSVVGFHIFNILTILFGEYYQFLFSPVTLLLSIFLFKEKDLDFNIYRGFGLLFFFFSITTIIGFFIGNYQAAFNLYPILVDIIGRNSLLLLFIGLFILSLIILFRFSPIHFTKKMVSLSPSVSDIKNTIKKEKIIKNIPRTKSETKLNNKKKELDEMMEELKREKESLRKEKKTKQLNLSDAPKKIKIEKKAPSKIGALFSKTEKKSEEKIQTIGKSTFKNWIFPKLDLLTERGKNINYDKNEIRRKEIEIQEKLLQFKIEVEMLGFRVGPTVIQYRLKPREGVKLQKIVNLKKDLTLALHAKNIRIQAPIPGLGAVGIEVPNDNRQAVGLREVLSSKEFNSPKLEIPIALGKDVSGNIMVGDLAKMPHLLIAGQTGSGKSVGMNGFLISLLYKFSPSDLKMIMVDPKRVELSVYNGIPHLLTPVITNPDKALNALKWCVAEMLRRYDLATAVNARNLKEYNAKVEKDKRLPYIVFVIDELADLMMSGNKKEVEQSISRIAQMARAVGIHLIVATQRPSVDVITGLIKANIPSRIAFTVASHIDSQTIIGQKGAEDLLGRGDMLSYPTGNLEPERVQGVLVETDEVEAVVNQLKLTIDPDILNNLQDSSIVNGKSKTEGSILENYKGDQDEDPELIEKAILVVKESGKGSTSLIQRKLGLGYARAAKVLDILEELGVVGPSNGSKPREVYVD